MSIALYHFHVTQIKRSAGQSAIASAAYRSGEKLHSEYYGEDDERFSMMSRSYATEQEQLKVEIQTLQQDIKVQERQIENLEQFIQRVHKYKDLDELTPYALRELVKGVYIEAPDKSSGKRRQNIRISYDLVGILPASLLADL